MPSRCSWGVTLLPGGVWSPPQLGTSRCRSPPVCVLASLGHMTVNLRRQLPTPSACCLGTPNAPEPPQLWLLRHPLSGHMQHLPSSRSPSGPTAPHSSGPSGSSTHSPMAQPAAALGLPPCCLREEAMRSVSSLFPPKKHPGDPPPITPAGRCLVLAQILPGRSLPRTPAVLGTQVAPGHPPPV